MDEMIVFVRIALYMVAGRAVAGGWMPQEVADMFVSPEMVEIMAGAVLGLISLIWYWVSKARKSLVEST